MNEVVRMDADASTVAILNKSEIDQQIATAHQFPRSVRQFRDEALDLVTLTESVADECIYSLPRDGKIIEGPSARFAEIIQSAWGNCRSGARVIDEGQSFIVAQGVFHDLQRNAAITYEVRRRITNKHGRRYSDDMIGVTANAACSIALRNAVLKGIPKALWADMYDAARQTVMGDFKTLANRRADAVKAFQAYGVTEEMLYRLLSVKGLEDISREHLVTLRGVLTAIKEGDTTVEQAFALKPPSPPSPRGISQNVPSAPSAPPKAHVPNPVQGHANASSGASSEAVPSNEGAPGNTESTGNIAENEQTASPPSPPAAPATGAPAAGVIPSAPPASQQEQSPADYNAMLDQMDEAMKAAGDIDALNEIWAIEIEPMIDQEEIFPPDQDRLTKVYHKRFGELKNA